MSLPFCGTRPCSKGLISAIAKQLRSLTLKPTESITVKFDPFHNALETRDFFFHITTPKILATNRACVIKPKIVSDLSEPEITVKLRSGDNVIFKSANLTALNILQLYNKHITPLSPPEPEGEGASIQKDKKKKRKRPRIKPESKHRGVFL